ncbi:ATP-dependent zinc protease [Legionella worsleiensis]|uniref:Secreted protein n=1 Tax=Legionella worsleiensis TaxID=45076 RepID=A0A0W1AJW6_9GAMM|nr:secreted protein [Legionella worsleiensis]STY32130.1 secreted protein [Legionella worsleiensis]
MRSIFALFLFMSLLTGSTMAKSEVQIYGYVEKATLVDKNLTLSAKLDTGAKSASLNAVNITEIDVNGVPYLRFTVPTKNGDHVFECEYIGKVKIKVRANEASPGVLKAAPIKRPVVLLNVKLGDKVRAIQVNLTNRKHFIYPLLLGRDAIIDFDGAVDPALTFTLKSKSASS